MWNSNFSVCKQSLTGIQAHPFIISYGCFLLKNSRSQELSQRLYGLKSLKCLLSDSIERKCWALAFIRRFLALFLLNLGNGELLLQIRGRGMADLWYFFSSFLSLEPLWVGWISVWMSQRLPGAPWNTKPFPSLCACICCLPYPSRPRAANVPPCSKALGTRVSLCFPHTQPPLLCVFPLVSDPPTAQLVFSIDFLLGPWWVKQ